MGDVIEEWVGRISSVEVEKKAKLPGNVINLLSVGSSSGNGSGSGSDGGRDSFRLSGPHVQEKVTDSGAFFTTPRKPRQPVAFASTTTTSAGSAGVGTPSPSRGPGKGGLAPPTHAPAVSRNITGSLLAPPRAALTATGNGGASQVNGSGALLSSPRTPTTTTAPPATAADTASPSSPIRSVRVVQPSKKRLTASSSNSGGGLGLLSAPKRNKFVAKADGSGAGGSSNSQEGS